jgi:kinesin family protein 18/19
MIANISPSATSFEDTSNTLKYANRAKKIKTYVNRNVLNVQYHISNYNDIIKNLKSEITELRSLLGKNDGLNNVNFSSDNNKQSN